MADQQRKAVYAAPPVRVADGYPAPPEAYRGPPREQLPPLSSIFASTRPAMPLPAPYRVDSPTYAGGSPQHQHQHQHHPPPPPPTMPPQMLPEQPPWEAAYAPARPSPPTSSPHPYRMRAPAPWDAERPAPALPSPSYYHFPGGTRPYDARGSPVDGAPAQVLLSRNNWSPRSEPSYHEGRPAASRDTSSSFRPQLDQDHPLPPRAGSQPELPYRNAYDSASPMQNVTSAPGPAGVADSMSTKDGLGPKIWTGTQFLPRFVRQAEVPGEGLCYFYDDGTHCKTHIDGEAVNAHWGVTKAGKPRKRLAIACITCREKKIKCDPDYPRCTQCEKFGRVCKFKNAPRGGHGSPELSPEAEESSARPLSPPAHDGSIKAEKHEESRSFSLHPSHGPSSPDSDGMPAKRAKHGHAAPSQRGTDLCPTYPGPSLRGVSVASGRRTSEHTMLQWSVNPLDSDQEMTMELMKLFFIHDSASGTHSMLPEKPFLLWFTNRCAQKSPDDLMLIYAMLALASVFSSRSGHEERGEQLAAVARYACEQSSYSLQLVQSRLLIAMYYYAVNRPTEAWDLCGAAVRAAIGLDLNLELERTGQDEGAKYPFDLRRDGYAECRRRTFWACYIVDKLNGYCSGHVSIINAEDIFLRLPCDERSYGAQIEANNAFFNHSMQRLDHTRTMSVMSHLIDICTIWGNVMSSIYRTAHRPEHLQENSTKLLAFQATTAARLADWHSSLPDGLTCTPGNIATASRNSTLGSFITAHSLYHSTQMELNHQIRPISMPIDQLEQNIRIAHSHAEALLLMADHLAARPQTPAGEDAAGSDIKPPFSAPFMGGAILSAIDIISTKGYCSSLPLFLSKIRGALAVIAELALHWHSARDQGDIIMARYAELVGGPAGWKGLYATRDYAAVVRSENDHGDRPREGDGGGPRTGGRRNDSLYAAPVRVWDRALETIAV